MAIQAFPVDAAQEVGLFMESVFYGCIYLVSFFACIRVLIWRESGFKHSRSINKKMLVAALLMFTFATMDVAFHLRHNYEAFILSSGDPIDTFEHTSYWVNVMKMACYVGQTFVGDAILLFRLWVVYSKKWYVVIVPMLFWLGTSVCGAMTIYIEATLDTEGALLNAKNLLPFITSMLSLTLATNITATSLIVRRIYKIRQSLKHRSNLERSPLTGVLVVLIESGLMYTTSIVVLFIVYMSSHNAQYGVSNSVVQIIGITFNLIITSVDRGEATQPATSGSRSHVSQPSSTANVPLHMINIQTTVSRYPDKDYPNSPSVGDVESGVKPQWESR